MIIGYGMITGYGKFFSYLNDNNNKAIMTVPDTY